MPEFFFLLYIILITIPVYIYAPKDCPLPGIRYQQVKTFVNPVLPGDHPDPTLLKVGADFYHCGSSFHFTPYRPVYHSTDLVRREIISRVITPVKGQWITNRPSAGVWQGAITYFYGLDRICFSANGQRFCKAPSPRGPCSDATPLPSSPVTGTLGYDNSIFVDEDGKPYIVIKNGQKINRLQAIGNDGQLTGTVINLNWINAKLQYSWAEGPVMFKRNGYYYYFPAGDVTGGQYVLRTKELTGDSSKWERPGDFFKPVTHANVGFRRPNHIAAPLQPADGTWWTIGQRYERYDGDDGSEVKKVYDNMLHNPLKAKNVPLPAGETVNADQGGIYAGMNRIIATLPQLIKRAYVIASAGCPAERITCILPLKVTGCLGKDMRKKCLHFRGIITFRPNNP